MTRFCIPEFMVGGEVRLLRYGYVFKAAKPRPLCCVLFGSFFYRCFQSKTVSWDDDVVFERCMYLVRGSADASMSETTVFVNLNDGWSNLGPVSATHISPNFSHVQSLPHLSRKSEVSIRSWSVMQSAVTLEGIIKFGDMLYFSSYQIDKLTHPVPQDTQRTLISWYIWDHVYDRLLWSLFRKQ